MPPDKSGDSWEPVGHRGSRAKREIVKERRQECRNTSEALSLRSTVGARAEREVFLKLSTALAALILANADQVGPPLAINSADLTGRAEPIERGSERLLDCRTALERVLLMWEEHAGKASCSKRERRVLKQQGERGANMLIGCCVRLRALISQSLKDAVRCAAAEAMAGIAKQLLRTLPQPIAPSLRLLLEHRCKGLFAPKPLACRCPNPPSGPATKRLDRVAPRIGLQYIANGSLRDPPGERRLTLCTCAMKDGGENPIAANSHGIVAEELRELVIGEVWE
jgi:hypothetical protein